MPGCGPNTGYEDALSVLVRLLQRPHVGREDVEEVIRRNCAKHGRVAPEGESMRRRIERLRNTLLRCGVSIEMVARDGPNGQLRAPASWRIDPRAVSSPLPRCRASDRPLPLPRLWPSGCTPAGDRGPLRGTRP